MLKYSDCLAELDEVLNNLSKENLQKIPEEIRKGIKSKKNKEYIWKYEKNKTLKEQKLNRGTIVMLSYLNMEYLLNDEQKSLMENFHQLNEHDRTKKIL